jgi:adenylate cyclase
MFTDMVGFSSSTHDDEATTLALLREVEGLVRPLLERHGGREVKSTGDGFLVVFDSALRAVQCAVEIQQCVHDRNAGSGVRPVAVRIGVHLGDIEERERDVFGDAVNVAARVEPLAEPGGVCITEPVFGQVHNKLPDRFERLPPTPLKNIRTPLGLYRLVPPWTVTAAAPSTSGARRLAVLPFANISPDPNDAYLADGLTEEMIAVLSQLRELRVIARTSIAQYRSTSKSIAQIGEELGVDSVLEGSVRKAGDQLRITVQLIDVPTQMHTWSNTFDRELDNVFLIQSEIAKDVATHLRVSLAPAEASRLEAPPNARAESYLAYLKGRTLLHVSGREAIDSARRQFELAIELDPNNAGAHSGLSVAARVAGWYYPDEPFESWDGRARRSAERALSLDPGLADAHLSLAISLWDHWEWGDAEREFRRALELNPSYAEAHAFYAALLMDQGRGAEALTEFVRCADADPLWAEGHGRVALLLSWMGRFHEAFAAIQRVRSLEPEGPRYYGLLAEYYRQRADLPAATRAQEALVECVPPEIAPYARARLAVFRGDMVAARALLEDIERTPMFPAGVGSVVELYGEMGDVDSCFRWIERAGRLLPLQGARMNPLLASVRADPRFTALLHRMHLA